MVPDVVKTILAAAVAFAICLMSMSVSYSMATKGSAEFRFYYDKEPIVASYTHGIGFNVWGYHVELFNQNEKVK